jgi:putative Holliday junction resolvase
VRVLALDYGTARIGVAVSDPEGITAQPLEAIQRGRGRGNPLAAIARLVREYEVERIVVGLPLHMEGQPGEQARAAQAFGGSIAASTGLPVEYLDERWTTLEAGRALDALGVRGRRRRERLDGAAAAILLRTFLDRRRVGQAPPGARSDAQRSEAGQAPPGARSDAQRSEAKNSPDGVREAAPPGTVGTTSGGGTCGGCSG